MTYFQPWELEVYRLIGMGLGTNEIACKLNLIVKNIDSYRERLKPCCIGCAEELSQW